MRKQVFPFAPLGLAVVLALLLIQTGPTHGFVERLDPPKEVPGFDLPALDGQRYSLEEFRGRPFFLSLWATWCAPCQQELPQFDRVRKALAESHPDVVMMTANIGESGARAGSWMKRHKLDLPVLLASEKFVNKFEVMVLPSILVFNRDGRLASIHRGWSQSTDLLAEVKKDLAAMDGKKAD
ncbi:MAG: TlpA family protein disulfide reductase [Acidobacteriota bacterium]